MKKLLFVTSLLAAFVLGIAITRVAYPAATASAASINPSSGYTIHIDAQKHFGDAHPDEIAHHWCKNVAGGMIQCQIYDNDSADARLVAVETIVSPSVYKSFTPQEQAYWHYHKVEIPKVNATMPDVSAADAQKMVAQISDTYGKIWLLYDPMSTNNLPTGSPSVTVLK
ncbi:MAG TPA: DUF1264 domain-containing protein [Candidatus Baltobacteraceae bacterium]|jgi:hypothetical protein|nr:DUF1264 domain-containing protein [Candidatus Baltobacteraceae bacterium]